MARLLTGGPAACAQKLGEEGVEVALAAVGESDERPGKLSVRQGDRPVEMQA